jgi:hypothetical protein
MHYKTHKEIVRVNEPWQDESFVWQEHAHFYHFPFVRLREFKKYELKLDLLDGKRSNSKGTINKKR